MGVELYDIPFGRRAKHCLRIRCLTLLPSTAVAVICPGFLSLMAAMCREVGGCMVPVWPQYFAACSALLYVIDATAAAQLPEAVIELLQVLRSAHMQVQRN